MKSFVALSLLVLSTAQAATIAVIDSGLDYKHEMIESNLWVNPRPVFYGPYVNVNYGWNFAEKNNQVIDYDLLDYFSPDLKTFYDIQAKAQLRIVSQKEVDWFNKKIEDEQFIKDVNSYGTYIHGTHVAGIAVKDSHNKAMGIKLLGTNVKSVLKKFKQNTKSTPSKIEQQIREVTAYIAFQSTFKMREIGLFINSYKADIANGSYGISYNQAYEMAGVIYQEIVGKPASQDQQDKVAELLMEQLIEGNKMFVDSAPNTLFVFAAGNEGSNNDKYGFSPANLKTDNTISVAATYQDQFLASFSNYGVKKVDVAAPGMLIRSAVPGEGYLFVSGTSQAAPYVSNVAGQVKDANPKLRPADIKKIIMETVDKKSFLLQKVKSGGMVNLKRAVFAAELSRNLSIKDSIDTARRTIPNLKSNYQEKADFINVTPIPMPSPLN
jgi:cell wall-associated protease